MTRRGRWSCIATASFQVWSTLDQEQSVALAHRCEKVRRELLAMWNPAEAGRLWSPRAEVVLHASSSEYGRATGCSGTLSSGCTTVSFDGARVVLRRVDLRADATEWSEASLPHEIAHLILADRFPGQRLPRWVDEGIAVLAESESKQSVRRAAAGNLPRLSAATILRCADSSVSTETNSFYVESAELVQFLLERGSREKLLAFIESAREAGCDAALRKVYQIDGCTALQREWSRAGGARPGA